jgi:hypothetical protein
LTFKSNFESPKVFKNPNLDLLESYMRLRAFEMLLLRLNSFFDAVSYSTTPIEAEKSGSALRTQREMSM